MRVLVDRNVCQGTGLCVAVAADVFEILDDGAAALRVPDTAAAEHAESVREAVAVCPVGALRLLTE